MRPQTHVLVKSLATSEVKRIPFGAQDFAEVGIPFAPLSGIPTLEAYQLVNTWNIRQPEQRFVFALEV